MCVPDYPRQAPAAKLFNQDFDFTSSSRSGSFAFAPAHHGLLPNNDALIYAQHIYPCTDYAPGPFRYHCIHAPHHTHHERATAGGRADIRTLTVVRHRREMSRIPWYPSPRTAVTSFGSFWVVRKTLQVSEVRSEVHCRCVRARQQTFWKDTISSTQFPLSQICILFADTILAIDFSLPLTAPPPVPDALFITVALARPTLSIESFGMHS